MKKKNKTAIAIAMSIFLLSCSTSPDAQFKSEVREIVNEGSYDPQINIAFGLALVYHQPLIKDWK